MKTHCGVLDTGGEASEQPKVETAAGSGSLKWSNFDVLSEQLILTFSSPPTCPPSFLLTPSWITSPFIFSDFKFWCKTDRETSGKQQLEKNRGFFTVRLARWRFSIGNEPENDCPRHLEKPLLRTQMKSWSLVFYPVGFTLKPIPPLKHDKLCCGSPPLSTG